MDDQSQNVNKYEVLAKAIALLDSDNKLVVFLILASFIGAIAGLLVAMQCEMLKEYRHISYGILTISTFILLTIWILLFLKHIKGQEVRHYADAEQHRQFELDKQRLQNEKYSKKIDSDKDIKMAEIEYTAKSKAKVAEDELDVS